VWIVAWDPSLNHRLLLLRHAKSSWDDPSLADHDRPLANRGRRAAEVMGAHLRRHDLVPGLVLCSSAARTRETLERLKLDGPKISIEDRLYAASEDNLLGRLRELGDDERSVLVIGHNPGIQDLALEFVGAARTGDAGRVRAKFPTGALAVFEFDVAWSELAAATARLASFITPRDLT
jgi:phosphohistidine phosphatase